MNDVIVIGAGPVGLFSALLLGQQGLSVVVYERWPTFYPLPRACTIDHEAIRAVQSAGFSEEFTPLIDPIIGPDKTYEFVNKAGDTLLKVDWNRPGASGWAQANMFCQPDLERLLVRQIELQPNVHLHRGRELIGVEQMDDHVSLTIANTQDSSDLSIRQARYVIGADGARSTVRELAGISQTDLGFESDWLVVDVLLEEGRVWKPYIAQYCDPARPKTLVGSGPGRRRWEFMRLPEETIQELNTVEKAWELLAPWDITPDNAELERHAVYTFRGSWADSWQEGRMLLAGDAAHLMPPFLAQGLCSGLRDAMALAWRLPLVIKGEAPESLLESYGPERSEHVQEIIEQAIELGRVICMLDPAQVEVRDAQMKAAMLDPSLALKPPPEPRLGAGGVVLPGDQNAGYLSVQGRISRDGKEGLFDDVVGAGWQLLYRDGSSTCAFGNEANRVMDRLQIVSATFGEGGDTIDLDGTYGAWFERTAAEVILVRPDFYVFGTGGADDAEALLIRVWEMLQVQSCEPREGQAKIQGTAQ